tara:strand:- start:1992 stop:2519 length:528 start_codon:yes stop_codon:yes gene_type:complete
MAYLIEKITEIDESIFRGLFNDSIDKINAGTFLFKEAKTDEEKYQFFKQQLDKQLSDSDGFTIQIKKDNVIVGIASGRVRDKVFNVTITFFGKDASGSRAYLYDTDWITAMKNFHLTMSSVYTSQQYTHTKDSSSKLHYESMMTVANNDAAFNHTQGSDVEENTFYVKTSISDIT